MYVIIVYDVLDGRTEFVRKLCQKYLFHVQDSVFEGKISKGELRKLKDELQSFIVDSESIICYESIWEGNIEREVYGDDPKEDEMFL